MKKEINYSDGQKELFDKLTPFMLDYNSRVNLTRITDENEIWEKHYADSILPLLMVNIADGARVIDIGTGAGFPGVPWKIYRPDLDITLLDSLQKRIVYLEKLKEHLELDYNTVHGRSEELAHNSRYRESFDIAVSRAVANLPALAEYCMPFVKINGIFIAMKGIKSELEEAANSVIKLGGKVEEVKEYELSGGDKRTLIVIRKISHTPSKYPRKSVNISKNPL